MKTMNFLIVALAAVVGFCTSGCEIQNQHGAGAGSTAADSSSGNDSGSAQADAGSMDAQQCTPKCNGKVCGDDGCGGQCGTCNPSQQCSAGQCVAKATEADAGSTDIDAGTTQDAQGGSCGCQKVSAYCNGGDKATKYLYTGGCDEAGLCIGVAGDKGESISCVGCEAGKWLDPSQCSAPKPAETDAGNADIYAGSSQDTFVPPVGDVPCSDGTATCKGSVQYKCDGGIWYQKFKPGICHWADGKEACSQVKDDNYVESVDSHCDDADPNTIDVCSESADWVDSLQKIACQHVFVGCSATSCPTGYNCNTSSKKCEQQTQSDSTTTSYPSKWSIESGPDVVQLQVKFFATNTFGDTEIGYKLMTTPGGLPSDTTFYVDVPGGVGAICIDTKHVADGKTYWVPGQVGGKTVNLNTQYAWPTDYWYKSAVVGPNTPACEGNVITPDGCTIGKVYADGSTDNWNCFVPSAWQDWCGGY